MKSGYFQLLSNSGGKKPEAAHLTDVRTLPVQSCPCSQGRGNNKSASSHVWEVPDGCSATRSGIYHTQMAIYQHICVIWSTLRFHSGGHRTLRDGRKTNYELQMQQNINISERGYSKTLNFRCYKISTFASRAEAKITRLIIFNMRCFTIIFFDLFS